MSMKNMGIGGIAFIVGLLLVFVIGFELIALEATMGTAILVLIGLIVAYMNISGSESVRTLLAGVVLAIAGVGLIQGAMAGIFAQLGAVMTALGTYFLAIVIWLALITIFQTAKGK